MQIECNAQTCLPVTGQRGRQGRKEFAKQNLKARFTERSAIAKSNDFPKQYPLRDKVLPCHEIASFASFLRALRLGVMLNTSLLTLHPPRVAAFNIPLRLCASLHVNCTSCEPCVMRLLFIVVEACQTIAMTPFDENLIPC